MRETEVRKRYEESDMEGDGWKGSRDDWKMEASWGRRMIDCYVP